MISTGTGTLWVEISVERPGRTNDRGVKGDGEGYEHTEWSAKEVISIFEGERSMRIVRSCPAEISGVKQHEW